MTFGKVSFIGTLPMQRGERLASQDMVTRFDLSVCQVAMTVAPSGARTFVFGNAEVANDIASRVGRVMFVDNARLAKRVHKYRERGFDFGPSTSASPWYRNWEDWVETHGKNVDDELQGY